MIATDQHLIEIECDCDLCVSEHWNRHHARYTMPTKALCLRVMESHGYVFEDGKVYAPKHLEKYGRFVSKWDK